MEKKEAPQINKLCRRCVRYCKQSADMQLLNCPRYERRSFDPEEFKFEQMELFKK